MNQQWQRYQALELIPDSAPAPRKAISLVPLTVAWRSLLNALAREQFYEKRTEYLERCWQLDYEQPYAGESKALHKLWMLMD